MKILHPAAQKLEGKTDLRNFPDSSPCFILASSAAFSSPNPPEHESSVTLQESGMTKLVTQSEVGETQAGSEVGAGCRGEGACLPHDSSLLADCMQVMVVKAFHMVYVGLEPSLCAGMAEGTSSC